MGDEHVKEAGWVVQSVTGGSAYAYGISYDVDTWNKEVDAAVEYIKSQAG